MKLPATPLTVRYGSQEFPLRLPGGKLAARIEPRSLPPTGAAAEIIGQALDRPIGAPRLRDFARGQRSAAILVPGKDRVAAAEIYVPLLLEELNLAGIPDEAIEVFLAIGTHVKHSREEIVALLGADAAARVRWREHDCQDATQLRSLGVSSSGNEVLFNTGVLDSEVKVLTGRIIPHYFAGYGGGRKALLPGVAAFQTIRHNHRLTLDPQRGIHPQVRPCSLEGNPVHLDMIECARMVGPVFSLNTLLDINHAVIGAYAGAMEPAHAAGCAETEKLFRIGVKDPVDALITSAGGWPYDCSFMQALKAVFNVQEVVRAGGSVLWIARSEEGMKKDFLHWGRIESDEEMEDAVRANYNLTGHNSIMLRKLVRRLRVAFWSDLPDDEVRTMGLHPVHSLEEGIAWLAASLPPDFSYAVARFANVTCATLDP